VSEEEAGACPPGEPGQPPGGPEWLPGASEWLPGALDQLSEAQDLLRQDFERLAAAVMPLLTKQYQDTERRMRALETRLRNRQERPLIIRMANLLADVRRLDSAGDIKEHVQDAMLDALTKAGYQEFGSAGDRFDLAFHEPVSGSMGTAAIVTHVHCRGLACYGDVILKAKVDVAPGPAEWCDAETAPGEEGTAAELSEEAERGGLPA
jgi:molecular chaperone GrpE (heat shock protein)